MSRCPNPLKGAYPTRKIAKKVAVEAGRKHNKKLFVYKCPECRCWHLTRQEHG